MISHGDITLISIQNSLVNQFCQLIKDLFFCCYNNMKSQIIHKHHSIKIQNQQTSTEGEVNRLKFLPNVQIKDLLLMDSCRVALVRHSSILVYNTHHSEVEREIHTEVQIDRVVFSKKANRFFFITSIQRQLYSIDNQSNTQKRSEYKHRDNRWKNIDLEWSSWLYILEGSQKVVLVRKFYGESLVVIFNTEPEMKKEWEFSCNQECLSKLDQQFFLVSYRQHIRSNVTLQLFDTERHIRSTYKITENQQPHTCVAVKLNNSYSSFKIANNQQKWLRIVIGVNYKFEGRGLIFVSLFEESDHYEITATLSDSKCELYDILAYDTIHNTISMIEYKYESQTRSTDCFLNLYKQDDSCLTHLDTQPIDANIEGIRYSHQIGLTAIYQSKLQKKGNCWAVNVNISFYKQIQKKQVYLHLLHSLLPDREQNLDGIQRIIELL